jgi:hypothetical protein
VAITRGQKSALAQVGGGAGTTLAVTWSVNPSAGSTILLFVQSGTPALTPSSVQDNGTTPRTFTLDQSSTSGAGCYIYRANSITLPGAGSYTVTVTLGSSRTLQAAGIEYAGVQPGSPAAVNTSSGTGTSVATGSAAPGTAGGLVFGGFTDTSGLNPETITFTGSSPQTSQFTATNGSTWFPMGVADALTGSGQSFTWTLGDSVAWAGISAAYAPAGTAPGPMTAFPF